MAALSAHVGLDRRVTTAVSLGAGSWFTAAEWSRHGNAPNGARCLADQRYVYFQIQDWAVVLIPRTAVADIGVLVMSLSLMSFVVGEYAQVLAAS